MTGTTDGLVAGADFASVGGLHPLAGGGFGQTRVSRQREASATMCRCLPRFRPVRYGAASMRSLDRTPVTLHVEARQRRSGRHLAVASEPSAEW